MIETLQMISDDAFRQLMLARERELRTAFLSGHRGFVGFSDPEWVRADDSDPNVYVMHAKVDVVLTATCAAPDRRRWTFYDLSSVPGDVLLAALMKAPR